MAGTPTTLIPHNVGDFASAREQFVLAAASGAVAIPDGDTTVFITKSSALAALTLADPTSGIHDGLRLTVVATTAYAHTLSNAAGSGFNGGGASSDVGTFGGAVGDNIRLIAYGGKWHVMGTTNVTLG